MATYQYTILDPKGRQRSGRTNAASEDAARTLITRDGDLIISLKAANTREWLKFERRASLSLSDGAAFAEELAGLLIAGAPLRKALAIMSDGKSASAEMAASCLKSLDEGRSFSDGVAQFSGSGQLLAEFARAGEAGAGLDALMASGARFMTARAEALSRIRAALAYPIFICVLAIVAVSVITFYVAPSLAPILEESGQTGLITTLAGIGEWARARSQIILIAIASVVALTFVMMRRPETKAWLNSVLWRLPWLGSAARDLDTGQSCDVMSALLERGRSLEVSLKFASSVAGPRLAKSYMAIADRLRDGVVASEAFANEKNLPRDVRRLILLGERSSAFAHAIKQAGQICHARALKRIDRVAAILGPALVVGLGVLVSLLMLSVLNSLGSLGDVG
jgi:general secretion pathway protein F